MNLHNLLEERTNMYFIEIKITINMSFVSEVALIQPK